MTTLWVQNVEADMIDVSTFAIRSDIVFGRVNVTLVAPDYDVTVRGWGGEQPKIGDAYELTLVRK